MCGRKSHCDNPAFVKYGITMLPLNFDVNNVNAVKYLQA